MVKFLFGVKGVAGVDDVLEDWIFQDVEGDYDSFGDFLKSLVSLVEVAGVDQRISVAQGSRRAEGVADVFRDGNFDGRERGVACALVLNVDNRLALELFHVLQNRCVHL